MAQFFLKRLLALPLLIFGTSTLIFFIIRLLPGDPVLLFLSPSFPPALADQLRHAFGLDKPLIVQYLLWIKEVFTGSLGYSFTFQRDVVSVIGDALPSTIALACCTLVVEVAAGIALALASVRFHHSTADRVLSVAGLVTYTMPTFWIAFIFVQLFSVRFTVFPSSHMHSVSADELSTAGYVFDYAWHMILPVATLAVPGAAGMARFLRSSIITASQQKYVTVARSMGVDENRILYSYILPNALSSMVTLGGLSLGSLLTGALLTETIFALPGMGRLIVTAIFSRDYPLVVGCVIAASCLYISVNFCTDIIHYLIDPRIKRTHE
ncbi:MAG TPA: ABC transporter permease [Bacteroidota bacterium]|nr:ABC transporter permease [Bacteroidota bacterium]